MFTSITVKFLWVSSYRYKYYHLTAEDWMKKFKIKKQIQLINLRSTFSNIISMNDNNWNNCKWSLTHNFTATFIESKERNYPWQHAALYFILIYISQFFKKPSYIILIEFLFKIYKYLIIRLIWIFTCNDYSMNHFDCRVNW